MFFGNRNIMIVKKLRVCVDFESFFEGGGLREIYFVRVFKVYFFWLCFVYLFFCLGVGVLN